MSLSLQYSTTEWNLAFLLSFYVVLDFIVRFHSTFIALKNKQRIFDYYSGWMTAKLYKEWFMFVRWNRLMAYFFMLLFLHHVGCMLLFYVLAGKFVLEIGYHLLMKILSSKLL